MRITQNIRNYWNNLNKLSFIKGKYNNSVIKNKIFLFSTINIALANIPMSRLNLKEKSITSATADWH